MFKLLNLEPEIFAIDINDFSIKVAKIKKKKNKFVLTSFNEVEINHGIVEDGAIKDEDKLIKAIKLACRSVKGEPLKTRHVIASLPEEKSFIQTLQMPQMSEEELKLALPFEIENYIPLPMDKIYWDFQSSESVQKNSSAQFLFVNAMPRAIVNSYVFCLKGANLIPCALEVESHAVARALAMGANDNLPRIVIDIGKDSSSLTIFSGSSIRLTYSIQTASRDITQSISENLSVDEGDAEALKIKYGLSGEFGNVKMSADQYRKAKIVSEAIRPILRKITAQVKKYIDFYHNHTIDSNTAKKETVKEIILCGGGSNLKGLADFFWNELTIKTVIINPLLNIASKKFSEKEFSSSKALSFTVAIGLAMRGAMNID